MLTAECLFLLTETMNCDDCKEQPASVHLTRVTNGQKVELHLCAECAHRRGIQIFPMSPFPVSAFKPIVPTPHPTGHENRACSRCRYTWREFLASGFLGCTDCYQSFADLLSQLITKNYGPIRHQGKFPHRGAESTRIRREIARLRGQLEKVVTEEDFEKAARLRDRIRELEKKS